MDRRTYVSLTLGSLGASLLSGCARPAFMVGPAVAPTQRRSVSLVTGSVGGGFLLYGQAAGSVLAERSHLDLKVLATQGTAENIKRLAERDVEAALLVMGPTWDAWNGLAQWAGKPEQSMRALLPMYETPFHVAVLATSPITSLIQLAGKRVGVGPTKGTAEGFFRGLMQATGLNVTLVNGSPSQHAQQLAQGEIDAFWFGAGLPVPAFEEAAKLAPIRVFGLSTSERAAFTQRFPYFAPYTVPAGTYAGQSQSIESVAVWNFVAMHRDAPNDLAYWLTRACLENATAIASRYPAARASTLANLRANTFMPFHPGALQYFKEKGVAL